MTECVLKSLIGIIIPLCIMACGLINTCEDTEMDRLTSPDGKVDCVLVQRNCGATTSYVYNIFLVSKGKSIGKADPVFRADHVKDLTMQWQATKRLELRYKEARIFHFSNFWQSRDVDNFAYVVEINEVSLSPHALSPRDRWETDLPANRGTEIGPSGGKERP